MRKRYVQVNGQLVEVTQDFIQAREAGASHNVIADIAPYQSMISGEMIGGRRQHREHLRQHGMVEVGNEHDKLRPFKVEAKVDWREALKQQMGRKGML